MTDFYADQNYIPTLGMQYGFREEFFAGFPDRFIQQ